MTFHDHRPLPRLVASGGPVSRAVQAGRGEAFPQLYALYVEGGCCAPEIPDGSHIFCDTNRAPKVNDFVVVHFTPEAAAQIGFEAWIKRLVLIQRPSLPASKSKSIRNIQPCVVVEQLNPQRTFTLPWAMIRAIHWCGGVVPDDWTIAENQAAVARRAAHKLAVTA